MSRAVVVVLGLLAVVACAHAPTRESCLAGKGFWADANGGGTCYDGSENERSLDGLALGKLDSLFGSPTLPATTDAILGWTVQRGAKTTCGDDTTTDCTAGPITVGSQPVTLHFHLKEARGERRAYAVDLEGVDGSELGATANEAIGKSASACQAGHEEIWVLEGGLLRVGAKSATFLVSGKACP